MVKASNPVVSRPFWGQGRNPGLLMWPRNRREAVLSIFLELISSSFHQGTIPWAGPSALTSLLRWRSNGWPRGKQPFIPTLI